MAYDFILANSNWNLTAFLALMLSGLLALGLGLLLGNKLWRRNAARAVMIESENERLSREAAALERACRELETSA